MYYDSHTHLNDDTLYPERKKFLKNFSDVGGKGLVNIGVNKEWNQKSREISHHSAIEFPEIFVKSAIGYHPSEVIFGTNGSIEDMINTLQKEYEQQANHIVAIGECGIDLHYPDSHHTINNQKKLFGLQCELAQQYGLPIVIHSREGFYETLDVLENFTDLKIYFHCWGYGPEEISILCKKFNRLRIGFCGNITYPKAEILRESFLTISKISRDHILFETDAPYLAPQTLRGQTNEPANVKVIYEYVANLFGKNINALEQQIEKNFFSLYR